MFVGLGLSFAGLVTFKLFAGILNFIQVDCYRLADVFWVGIFVVEVF